jgi:molybdopterin-guanine dinucleotide biosynthesis protein A
MTPVTVGCVFDAIVLAGGSARRLDGVDKPGLLIGGRTLLAGVVDAVRGAATIVVVGPARADVDGVVWCHEDPAGGGPVAAIGAGVARVSSDVVLVLAADLPYVAGAVRPLLDAVADPQVDVAVLVDPAGRRNHLAAAWHAGALRRRIAALDAVDGAAARTLFADAAVSEVRDAAGWGRDCDTWDDVAQARKAAAQKGERP